MRIRNYIFVIFISAAMYTWLLYFVPRLDFLSLLGGYTVLGLGYLWLVDILSKEESSFSQNVPWIVAPAIAFRLIAVFALPE